MTGVLIVDDHWVVHEGIERVLSESTDVHLEARAFTVDEAKRTLTRCGQPIDVVILDLVIEDGMSFDSIAELKRIRDGVRVLVLSMLSEDPYAVRAIEAGADGFLTKGGRSLELLEAIRAVASGSRYITPSVGQLLAAHVGERKTLSPRELEIVRHLAEGRRPGEIARLLALSPKTVSAHKTNAMGKLGVKSSVDLIRWAMDHLLA